MRSELRWPSVAGLTFEGRTVVGTHAYGKHLFTRFDDERTLHTHLRMEGVWYAAGTLPTMRLGDPGGTGAPSADAAPDLLLPGLPAAGVRPVSRPA